MIQKTIFIPAKYEGKIIIPDAAIKKLPDKLILFSSVQFLEQLKDIKKHLEKHNKKIITIKSKNFLYAGMLCDEGQLLGCNQECFDKTKDMKNNFDAFLYIGDGIFHPKALMIKNRKDIYCYNPSAQKLEILKKELHDEYEKKKKGAILKFLISDSIGILISAKPGQENRKRAETLKTKIMKKYPNKKIFLFITDEINFSELENFNFVDIFINTACPRIAYDDSVRTEKTLVNIDDVEEVL